MEKSKKSDNNEKEISKSSQVFDAVAEEPQVIKNWVLVEDGIVIEKRPYKQDENYIEAPSDVVPGFKFSGGEFKAPAQNVESLWSDVRAERNKRLAASDWTQLADSPLSTEDKTEWADYRQALRDVTKAESPEDVEWPEEPSA